MIKDAYLEFDKKELLARGEYLTEVIDKIEGNATIDDVKNLPKDGRYVVTWGPSSGKTTAIRQFIVDAIRGAAPQFGVYATKRIDDVDQLYYDIVAQYYYKTKSLPSRRSILKFHSQADSATAYEDMMGFQETRWILCTHERLFIEPVSLIMMKSVLNFKGSLNTNPDQLLRDYIIVDEYPSTMFKRAHIKDVNFSIVPLINVYADPDCLVGRTSEEIVHYQQLLIARLIDDVYSGYGKTSNDRVVRDLVNRIPTPTNQSVLLDLKRGSNSAKSTISRNRLVFFSGHFIEKLSEFKKEWHSKEDPDVNNYLYYSLTDIPYRTMYILDGTGDLLFKGTDDDNKIVTDSRFNRKLKLNSVNKVKFRAERTHSTSVITQESSSIIENILEDNPGKKLLVYTWMNSKDEGEAEPSRLSDSILEMLDEPYRSRVRIIHYQSGNERVTSEFIDCDMVLVLGKFFIPNTAIQDLYYATGSDLTTRDYSMALTIQAIYRSIARKGGSIDLFFSSDYDDQYITEMIDYTEHNDYKINYIDNYICKKVITENKLLMRILENCDDENKIDTDKITSLLGYKNFISTRVNAKLDEELIIYDYVKAKRSDKLIQWEPGYYVIHCSD